MRVPRGLRGSVEQVARRLGVVDARERGMRRGLTVLVYHRVLPDAQCAEYPFPSLVMPESHFRAQMAWLSWNCEALPLGSALERLESGPSPSRPLVSVTFDDGYADNRHLAAPIAEQHGLRCTFFVATDFVGEGRDLWFDRAQSLLAGVPRAKLLDHWWRYVPDSAPPAGKDSWIECLKPLRPVVRERFLAALAFAHGGADPGPRREPMTPADLRGLARAGHEIASHGTAHSVLTALSDAELEQELQGSRRRLGIWLGQAPAGLAYPDGRCDPRVVAAARRAGYRWACTTDRGLHHRGDEPLAIPRRNLAQDAVADERGRFQPLAFRCELCGLRDAWRRLRSA